MAVISSSSLPALPDPSSLYVARPARGRDMQQLVAGLSHLESWRFRRWTRAIVEVDASACPAVISGSANTPRLPPGPHTATSVARVVHHLCTDADHLWFCIGYQADGESSTKPRLDVQLYDLAGVLLDRGVRFDHTAGSLPTEREIDRGLYRATGLPGTALIYPVQWVNCGTNAEDDRRTEATPTTPRLLSLADATPRTRVEVRVTARFARVVSINVREHAVGVL